MVAIKEMTDVLRVVKEKTGLKPKQWVRLKRGVYKDDIAQVDYVDLAQNQVHLKLIPRIDYTKPRGALRTSQADNDDNKRKKKRRPTAKPFDPEAIRAIGGEVASDGDFLIFEGNRYSRKGFLYKNFTMSAIIADGPKVSRKVPFLYKWDPNLWLVKCRIGEEKSTALLLMRKFITYQFSNEPLQIKSVVAPEGLKGYIYIESYKVTHVKQAIENVGNLRMGRWKQQEPLEFQASELRKHFRMGDHVRVLAGRYEGDTGLIVRVEENRVVLFSDLTMHELEVLPRDLQLCSDMATGVDSLGQFQWGDLVQLDDGVKPTLSELERFEEAPEGVELELPTAGTKGLGSKGLAGLAGGLKDDAAAHSFSTGDNVEVCEGELMNLQGKILAIDGSKVTVMPKHEDLKVGILREREENN
ncbi:hypothetical protein J437_LFUL016324 [Ladona fulva]|uniref:Transcription elongation factor SPT5 n=1 Tax=Ladona fulva TaxID=123851 RepID=A0A8K0KKU4_LADFU|nr:hypothetical protein J437_LFUL016324 [Ladona fulva]